MLQTFALKSRLNNKIIQPVIYHRLPYDAELMLFSHNNTSFLAVNELPKKLESVFLECSFLEISRKLLMISQRGTSTNVDGGISITFDWMAVNTGLFWRSLEVVLDDYSCKGFWDYKQRPENLQKLWNL